MPPLARFFCVALLTFSATMVANIPAQHATLPKTKDDLDAKLESIARIVREQQQQQHIPGPIRYRLHLRSLSIGMSRRTPIVPLENPERTELTGIILLASS